MLRGERAQLGREVGVASKREFRLEPRLESDKPQLLEPRSLAARKLFVAELAVGRPAPEGEPADEQRHGERWVSRPHGSLPFPEQTLEPHRVHEGAVQLQGVARPSPPDRRRMKQSAQLRDVDLQKLVGRDRRRRAPNDVEQTISRTGLARSHDERSEQPTLLLGSKRQRPGGAAELYRPQNANLDHAASIVALRLSRGYTRTKPEPRRLLGSASQTRTRREDGWHMRSSGT